MGLCQVAGLFFSAGSVDFEVSGRRATAKRRLFASLIFAAAVAAPTISLAQSVSFQGLGIPPGWSQTVAANGVSADGKVVVGYGTNASGNSEAFRWVGGTITALGILPGFDGSFANAVNSDGSVVVGVSRTGNSGHAFRWAAGTMTDIDGLPHAAYSTANAVNPAGSVIAGQSANCGVNPPYSCSPGVAAFRSAGSWTSLDTNPPDTNITGSNAYGVNGDGTIVVGVLPQQPGGQISTSQAAIWVNGAQPGTRLGVLPDMTDPICCSYATAITPDGTVVVGASCCYTSYTGRAFLWTQATGMTNLGMVAGTQGSSANAVSADGKVVVGGVTPGWGGLNAWRWTAGTGMQLIRDLLIAAGVDMSAWGLNTATGISADGTIIVGSGNLGAWIAHLPLPQQLQLTPASNIAASGPAGGPFSPSSFQYQLSTSSGSVTYSITGIPSWLNASFTSGTATASPVTDTFSLTNVNSLNVGTYNATISFTNTTNGLGNTTRTATLTVTARVPEEACVTITAPMQASADPDGEAQGSLPSDLCAKPRSP